jgi:hypothetical protein
MRLLKIGCLISCICGINPYQVFGQVETKEKYDLVKEDENIYIYERWITYPNSKPPFKAREVKSEFKINGSIEDGLELLKDEMRIYKWQRHVSDFEIFPQTDSTWYEYSYHDIPWPVSDQDHFLKYRILDNVPGQKLFVSFETVVNDSLAPLNDDATRMYLLGSWLWEQKPTHVKVTYKIISKPIGIPRIFTDPVIRSNMMSTIKAYIKLIDDKKNAAK